MGNGLAFDRGLVALWRARTLVGSGLVGQFAPSPLRLTRVEYAVGGDTDAARVALVVATTPDRAQVRVARSDYTATSAAISVSQGPDEKNQDVVLTALAQHADGTSAVVKFAYPASPGSDFAVEVFTGEPAARQGTLSVSAGGQTVKLEVGPDSTLEQLGAALEPIVAGRPKPPAEYLDESLLRPHLEAVVTRLGELPPGVEGFNWKCLIIELAAHVVCGIACGVIAGVLCHEGSAR
jgi:hypothetical protein